MWRCSACCIGQVQQLHNEHKHSTHVPRVSRISLLKRLQRLDRQGGLNETHQQSQKRSSLQWPSNNLTEEHVAGKQAYSSSSRIVVVVITRSDQAALRDLKHDDMQQAGKCIHAPHCIICSFNWCSAVHSLFLK